MFYFRSLTYISFSSIILFTAGLALAAPQCKKVTSALSRKDVSSPSLQFRGTPVLQEYRGGLSAEKLATQNLQVDEAGNVRDLKNRSRKNIGKIKVFYTDRLFQWAEPSYHQSILEHGGITSGWMKAILESPPQMSGVGFYVSADAFDSGLYGTAATVFELTGPIFLFEANSEFSPNPSAETTIKSAEFADRAAKAGIDAFRKTNYQTTWMAVINHRILRRARKINASDVRPYLDSGVRETHVEYLQRTLRKIDDELTTEDKKRSFYKLVRGKPLGVKDLAILLRRKEGFSETHESRILKSLIDLLKKEKNISNFSEIFKSIIESGISSVRAKKFINGVYPLTADPEISLKRSFLDLFDVRTLANLKKLDDPNARMQTLVEYFGYAQSFDLAMLKNRNPTLYAEAFLAAVSYVYPELKFKKRNYDVVMGGDDAGSIQTLDVSDEVLVRLQANSLLEVKRLGAVDRDVGNSLNRVEVSYLSHKKLNSFLNSSDSKASESYVKSLTSVFLSSFQYPAPAVRGLKTAFERYQLFLSIHPFADGNGRFARLLYSAMVRLEYIEREQRGLTLPVYDLDLFLKESEFHAQSAIGAIMKMWVAESVSAEEFIERADQAMTVLKALYPEFESLI